LKHIYFLFFLVFIPLLLSGQTNTDFWFAAPEVTSEHGDQPIILRLTSFGQTANVTISEPANTTNFLPITINIPANSTRSYDLTSRINQVECKPANTPLNFGILIHSDVPLTVYYEESSTNNPELFTLKGNNALGTSFVIPSQDNLKNHTYTSPPAYNSFDIVATEDATTVTIIPKKPVVGHAAGVSYQVILNKGQTYCAQATGFLGTDHLMGSTVTSNNPVAITVKDDSDEDPSASHWDLTGDQIVPVNIVGTEYIVVRGYSNSTLNDWVYITATADNTKIYLNGSATPVATINSGATYHYTLLTTDLSSFIQTSQPVYVLHLTGYGGEAGTALLPPMNCTGSSQVAFTRTSGNSFELIILTKAGAQGSFTLDGNSSLVTAGMFSPVNGNSAFYYARIDFTSAQLAVGSHILKNSQDIFHLGLIQSYDAGSNGCAYGYFSDFASLNLGPDETVCPGTSVTFNAGPDRQSYEWTYNGSPFASGVQTITVSSPGLYAVTVNDHGCILTDEVQLNNFASPNPVISGLTSFCTGSSQQLSVTGTFSSYLWTTGATTQSITVSTSGTYGVSVTDNRGCQGSTSVVVTVNSLPSVSLAQPSPVCINAPPYALSGGSPAGGVYSGPGVTSGTGVFNPSSGIGPHLITYTYTDGNGCTNSTSKTLTVNDLPSVQLANQPSVCITAAPFQLSGGTPAGGAYSGPGVTSSTGIFDPSSGLGPHLITYTYTNGNNCINSASKTLTVNDLPIVSLSNQIPVCISAAPFNLTGGSPAGGYYSGAGVNSITGVFSPSSGAGTHLITYTYTNSNGCLNTASKFLIVFSLPNVQLANQPDICITSPPVLLTGGTPSGGTYSGPGVNSATGVFDPSVGAGVYQITYTYTDGNNCTNLAFKTLTVYSLPQVQLSDQQGTCITAQPFPLTGGSPAGGTYSGVGVNSSTGYFDPSAGTGTYLITYTFSDGNGCSNSTSKPLTVHSLPFVQIADQSAACISSPPFPLTGGSPAGGTYSGTGVNSLTGFFDPSSGAGTHVITYTYTDGNGCTNSAVKTLTVNDLPSVQLVNQPSVCISALPFQLSGGTPAGGTYSGPGVDPATGFFTPSSGAGPHTIVYSYTDANICTNTTSRTLTVYPLPVVLLPALAGTCITSPPFLLSGGTPSGGSYSGPGVNSTTGFFDPSTGTGSHTIIYTYTDANSCTNSNSNTLFVNPLPIVHLGIFPSVCITLPPFPLSGGNPSGGTYSGTGVNSLTGDFNPSSGPGIHSITYRYTDANTCTNTATSDILVIPLPLPSGTISGPDPVCEAAQNTPYALSGSDPLATSFNWEISPVAAGTVSGTSALPVVNLNSGFYGVTGIRFQPVSNCGNGNFSGYTNFTVTPNPDVWMQSCNDAVTTQGSRPFMLKGGIPPGGTYGVDGTPLPSGILDPSTLSAGAQNHVISYTYSNHLNCAVTKTQTLKVNPASGFICKNTLTDIRDLRTYPTFELVTGTVHRCWMSANLNYGTFIQNNLVQTDNCAVEKYCQGDDAAKCSESGGFYQWEELMNYLPATIASAEGKQGLCPPEWHVATEAEWAELENYYRGEGLAGWSLIDPYPVYGFHAKNEGVLYQNMLWTFMPPGFSATFFWTSTVSPFSDRRIFTHGVNQINASVSKYFSGPGNALPVRCVKD